MINLVALGFAVLLLVVGALGGYVVARMSKLDAKLGSAIGALVAFAGWVALMPKAFRS